jgi:uncharacterized RDD family membrane protein YckC
MSRITVLNQVNAPQGPFTREEMADKLQRGEFTLNSLAHVEGLTQWTPLRDVLARVDGTPPLPAAPVPAPAVLAPDVLPLGYAYAATMEPPAHLVYAGFWMRFAAIFVDSVVLLPLSLGFLGLEVAFRQASDMQARFMLALAVLAYIPILIVARWLYFALMESSAWQATLGKKLIGIRVTGMDGARIGFGQATGRYFGKFLSGMILCIGFMMAGFTQRKQALHDMIASTLVVRN